MPGHDPGHTGTIGTYTPDYGKTPGAVRWSYSAGSAITTMIALGPESAPPLVGRYYFGCANGRLYALNSVSAEQVTLAWTYQMPDEPVGGPIIGKDPSDPDGHLVYVACRNGRIYCVDEGGNFVWSSIDLLDEASGQTFNGMTLADSNQADEQMRTIYRLYVCRRVSPTRSDLVALPSIAGGEDVSSPWVNQQNELNPLDLFGVVLNAPTTGRGSPPGGGAPMFTYLYLARTDANLLKTRDRGTEGQIEWIYNPPPAANEGGDGWPVLGSGGAVDNTPIFYCTYDLETLQGYVRAVTIDNENAWYNMGDTLYRLQRGVHHGMVPPPRSYFFGQIVANPCIEPSSMSLIFFGTRREGTDASGPMFASAGDLSLYLGSAVGTIYRILQPPEHITVTPCYARLAGPQTLHFAYVTENGNLYMVPAAGFMHINFPVHVGLVGDVHLSMDRMGTVYVGNSAGTVYAIWPSN